MFLILKRISMRKYLLFCLAFCVLGCLAQDLIVRPNDPIIYKKEGGAFLWLGDTAWELFHVLDKEGDRSLSG